MTHCRVLHHMPKQVCCTPPTSLTNLNTEFMSFCSYRRRRHIIIIIIFFFFFFFFFYFLSSPYLFE
jgi:hypothetical protein